MEAQLRDVALRQLEQSESSGQNEELEAALQEMHEKLSQLLAAQASSGASAATRTFAELAGASAEEIDELGR
eukprot:6831583-Prymnesium_polylepis.1